MTCLRYLQCRDVVLNVKSSESGMLLSKMGCEIHGLRPVQMSYLLDRLFAKCWRCLLLNSLMHGGSFCLMRLLHLVEAINVLFFLAGRFSDLPCLRLDSEENGRWAEVGPEMHSGERGSGDTQLGGTEVLRWSPTPSTGDREPLSLSPVADMVESPLEQWWYNLSAVLTASP